MEQAPATRTPSEVLTYIEEIGLRPLLRNSVMAASEELTNMSVQGSLREVWNMIARKAGSRAESLRARPGVIEDPGELLRWCREDMKGDAGYIAALVTILPDLALEQMWEASRRGDAASLEMACRNAGSGVDAAKKGGDDEDEDGTCLLHVVRKGRGDVEKMVELLLQGGADIDARTKDGRTSLSFAANAGRETVVVDQANNTGVTPLYIAAENGHTEVVALLVKEGGAAVDQANNDGWTPLLTAADEGHTEVVALLVKEGGAAVDQAINDGATPLLFAAQKGHTASVELLLQHGAGPNIPMVRLRC